LESQLIVVSPGVRIDQPIFDKARARGIPVIGEVELACSATQVPMVAVTGTNGKSTTTSMIGAILTQAGRRALIGGNLAPGRPLCQLASEAAAGDVIVAEVSTFQLETIVDFRPAVGVVTNITPDHLDRHPDFETYAKLKAELFRNQSPNDFAVLNSDDQTVMDTCGHIRSTKLTFSRMGEVENGAWSDGSRLYLACRGEGQGVMGTGELLVPGQHNVENALAAMAATSAMGCGTEAMATGLRSFRGVPHRLEEVAVVRGVSYVNNSMCTNPAAGVSSLRAFDRHIVVIAGGREKGLDMGPFIREIATRAKAAILIGESRTHLATELASLGFDAAHPAADMKEAVAMAASLAEPGDVVLLAPGCSSFDMFSDFEERGIIFSQMVLKLPR